MSVSYTHLKGILGLAKIQGGKLEYGDGMSRADVGYLPQQKDYQMCIRDSIISVRIRDTRDNYAQRRALL